MLKNLGSCAVHFSACVCLLLHIPSWLYTLKWLCFWNKLISIFDAKEISKRHDIIYQNFFQIGRGPGGRMKIYSVNKWWSIFIFIILIILIILYSTTFRISSHICPFSSKSNSQPHTHTGAILIRMEVIKKSLFWTVERKKS